MNTTGKKVVEMVEEEIKDVDRISISKNVIGIRGDKHKEFPREEENGYRLFAEDIQQLQEEMSFGETRTLLLFDEKDKVSCQIEGKKIFCGKKPEEIRLL